MTGRFRRQTAHTPAQEEAVESNTKTPAILVLMVLFAFAGTPAPASAQTAQPQQVPSAAPPQSLQQKMRRLHDLVEKRQEEGADLQPVGELMQGFEPLRQERKFSEAEALVDRALKLLGESAATDDGAASGESSLIAYAARDANGRQQIFVVRPDGAGERQLSRGGHHNYSPALSEDGKRLAWVSDRSGSPQIWAMDADGSNPVQLTTEGENVAPAWSADGKTLAFASKRTEHSGIWVMESDGSNRRQLTTAGSGISDSGPAWAPDGRRIAFTSMRSGSFVIWVMNSDGSHMTQLTTRYGDRYTDSENPAWSPDGTRIAFWSGQAGKGYGNIWIIDEDGTNPRRLTNLPLPLSCDEPAWSPDGGEIAFLTIRNGDSQVWVMNPDGKNQRGLITTRGVLWGRVSWQPISGRP